MSTITFKTPEDLCMFCNKHCIYPSDIVQIIHTDRGIQLYIYENYERSVPIEAYKDAEGFYLGG